MNNFQFQLPIKERIFISFRSLLSHMYLHPPCILFQTNLPIQRGLGPINNSLSNLPLPSDQVLASQSFSISHLPRNSINTSFSPSVQGSPLLMSCCYFKMSFNNCVIWNNTAPANSWKKQTREMKEKSEYVPLMDVPSNIMILVKKSRTERGEREGGKDEMDVSVGKGMNRG